MSRPCRMDRCERPVVGRDLCKMHWKRWRRHGSPEDRTPEVRFWEKVSKSKDGCWTWTGRLDTAGYGYFYSVDLWPQSQMAHRAVFLFTGERTPAAEGLDVDHLCHQRSCVRPEHLRVATRRENAQNRRGADSNSKSGVRGVETMIRRGQVAYRPWVAVGGRTVKLGVFDDLAEAAAVAEAARRERYTVPGGFGRTA